MRGKLIRRFFGLFRSWWQHKTSFGISASVTALGLFVYLFTFVGERPTPLFESIQRIKLNTLDTRFRYPRGVRHISENQVRRASQ